jgi:ABC-2 type transport system permease protein
MRTIWAIAKREFGSYFKSPIATIVLAGFVLISGILFFDDQFFVQGIASMQGYFGSVPLVFMFFAPALAMRLLAEERGTGTIELLLTMPVRDREVVIGKYLAALGVLAVTLLCTMPFAVTVAYLGEMDRGMAVSGYLGAFCLGAVYLAVGLFGSALARDQVVAFIVGLVLCFGLYSVRWFLDPDTFGRWVQYASPDFHYSNLLRGILEPRSLVYFASLAAIFVLVSIQAVEARKWR